ncbi:MAG: peptidoglycan bridge formation glycyltransferase FemA/FemB family protein [Bacilli bacterium]|nr:peptidoglycan bridge formation glycyltransferase FemA/FemB family protein [Bacilli bacterium]
MYTFTNNLDKKSYDKFVENYSMASFMQEYEWANIKNNWDKFYCGLYKDKKLVGVCLILVKRVFKNIKLFYIPRGYLIDFTNFEELNEMTLNIKKLAKKNRAYVVKLDPNFCISDESAKGEDVEHHYSENYKIKHNNLVKLGYKYGGINKEFGKNFQPQYNMFAPICNKESKILTEEEILKTYKSKFKYYLGSFHEKRGVTFEITNNLNDLDKFVELLRITEKKQNISLRNKEYFVRILENFKDRVYLFFGNIDLNKYLEFLKDNNGKDEEIKEVKELIKENGNNMTLSTGLLLLPKNKKGIRTSEYLYAGNSSNLTKLNVSAGLVFEMIKFSKDNNCHYCNLGGIDGNLNDHLTTFKQKFNGRIMEFTGEYDLPISWLYTPIKTFYPLLLKVYKKIKR